ncbi:hypothetical protein C1H46_025733 [Malus baccata]|uniref:non-specific serine/threonine protein kinase n=1 Tax=Malus baccata TaxID=106549 RepID=A0A540LR45_MALBA|nr:hypothetical protein C1H46_025733 [Malus baccata]
MSCFPCFGSQRSKRSNSNKRLENDSSSPPVAQELKKQKPAEAAGGVNPKDINAKTFTFRELATATRNFRQECLLGEGGFGRVYKGTLQSSGQVVAVKQLDRHGTQGNEFLGDVLMLSLLHHPNLVNLIGYCADGDQRLLVYEFISGGSLDDRVLGNVPDNKPLDWYTRVKIAYGAALGLEYLHEKANPSVVYRDLKSSNILLDEEFNPKLSDVGLAQLGSEGDKSHGPSRLMGTYGFCAPEYSRSGEAQPLFRDPKKYPDMADPLLNKQFPEKDLNQAVAIASMCLQEEAEVRPFMSDVVNTLSFLSTTPPPPEAVPAPLPADLTPTEKREENNDESECVSEYSEDDDLDDGGDDDEDQEASDQESIRNSRSNCRSVDISEGEGSKNERQVTLTESKEWHSFTRGSMISRNDSVNSSDQGSKGGNNLDGNSSQVSSNQSKYASASSRSSSSGSTEEIISNSRKNSRKASQKETATVTLAGNSSTEEKSSEGGSVCTNDQDQKSISKVQQLPPILKDGKVSVDQHRNNEESHDFKSSKKCQSSRY